MTETNEIPGIFRLILEWVSECCACSCACSCHNQHIERMAIVEALGKDLGYLE